MNLAPDQREGAVARQVTRSALERDHLTADEIDEAVLVASELFSNAVKATNNGGDVGIALQLDGEGVQVSVSNHGDPFEMSEKRAALTDEGGRGLAIARSLGTTRVSHEDGVTTVAEDIGRKAE